MALRIMGPAVDIFNALYLTRAQAIGLLASLALQFRGIELAVVGRADDAVLDAVIHIASSKHGIVQKLNVGITQNRFSIVAQKTPFGPRPRTARSLSSMSGAPAMMPSKSRESAALRSWPDNRPWNIP